MRQLTPGFALAEALVALLLLAISLLGAAGTLLQSLAATRAAQWQSRAADLADDLAEVLRSEPGEHRATLLAQWQQDANATLPLSPPGERTYARLVELSGDAEPLPATHAVQLAWLDRVTATSQRLELPLAVSRQEP